MSTSYDRGPSLISFSVLYFTREASTPWDSIDYEAQVPIDSSVRAWRVGDDDLL